MRRTSSDIYPSDVRLENEVNSSSNKITTIEETTSTTNIAAASLAPSWIPDNNSTSCQICATSFTIVFRRHHCRACGVIVCGLCSSKKCVLPSLGFNWPQRVCDPCYERLVPTADPAELGVSTVKKLSSGLGLSVSHGVFSLQKNASAFSSFIETVLKETEVIDEKVVENYSSGYSGIY